MILGLQTKRYYGLNAMASKVWGLIQEPRTVREICDVIGSAYDVDAAACERDVIRFLTVMHAERLVSVVPRDA